MNATPATSALGANATPLLASTHTTLWLRAGLRAGASGGRSALDHGARLRAVLTFTKAILHLLIIVNLREIKKYYI